MTQEITATFDGKNFVPDEVVDLAVGEKVTITISDEDFNETPKKMSDEEIDAWIKKYSGSCGKMFNSAEEVDAYIKELREDRDVLGVAI